MDPEMSDRRARANPPCGPLEGLWLGGEVAAFMGVPYAEPPVGDRRWRVARPVQGWREVRPAVKPGPYCPQYDMDNVGMFVEVPTSEDCLFLNVWTPAPDRGARPVLFYIHGGGFETGSGANPVYSGEELARAHDVVVVTINYRLSIFGLPPFAVHGQEEPTNLALLDQVEALRWVRENIAAFGGDPGNVTLFGLSAGGWSIVALLGMPVAQGLFHKAVAQSSSALTTLSPQARSLAITAMLEKLSMPSIDPGRLLECSTDELIGAALAANMTWRQELASLGDRHRVFIPHLEEATLPGTPMERAAAEDAFRGPLLIGTVREEVGFNAFRAPIPFLKSYFRRAGTTAALESTIGRARAQAIWDGYESLRCQSEAQTGGMIRTALDYTMPSIRFAEARSQVAPTWMYQFNYTAPKVAAATHALDVIFWSGALAPSRLSNFFIGEGGIGDEERELSKTMQRDLVRLARMGNLDWEGYETAERTTKIYDLH